VEERIKRLEVITERLMRRAKKSVYAVTAPYPISTAIADDECIKGTVLRYMFPCEGHLSVSYIRLDKKPKNGISISVKVFNDLGANSKTFLLDKKRKSIDIDMSTSPGDCLEVSVMPVTDEDIINELWLSILWTPSVKASEIKQFLISELEKSIEDQTGGNQDALLLSGQREVQAGQEGQCL
jgi:hypothetical protein